MSNTVSIPRDRASFDFWSTVSIRYSDQDPMQHVNNVAITAYLEAARASFIREALGEYDSPEAGMVLANVNVDFLHEIKYPGNVEVGARLAHVGQKSFSSEYAIFQGDTCCVTSTSINVFFDVQNRVSRSPSAQLLAHLKELVK